MCTERQLHVKVKKVAVATTTKVTPDEMQIVALLMYIVNNLAEALL